MTPYNTRYPGQFSTTYSATEGPAYDSVVPYNYAEYVDFVVRDGLVQGDRKSPNQIYFQKTRTFQLLYDRMTKSSINQYETPGIGSSVYTEVYDAGAHCVDWSPDTRGALYYSRIPWDSLKDRVLQKVFDQMRYGKGNLVVDLAEAGETIKMLRNATSVRKLVKSFMKEVVRPSNMSGSRRLKYATDKWLEYRYGWMPLVSSTYELLKTLSKKVDKNTTVDIVSRAGYEEVFVEDFSDIGQVTNAQIRRNVELSGRVYSKYRMRGRDSMAVYDFTSLNPLGIAWELTPLSFVADWFTNVGDTLQLWEDHFWFANRFISGFQTETVKENISYSYSENYRRSSPPTTGGQLMELRLVKSGKRELREKKRFILDGVPSPGGLRIDVNINAKRMLDAASLIRGAFGKH